MIEQMESQVMAMHGVQVDLHDSRSDAANNPVTDAVCELGSKF